MAEDGFQWQVTPGQAFKELYEAYTNTLFQAGGRVTTRNASLIEAWMKDNAPWTDRTGEARATLRAIPEQNPGTVGSIFLTHGAPHGLWLEIAYGGKWAIITKAIDYWGPRMWRDIQNMMNLKLVSPGE